MFLDVFQRFGGEADGEGEAHLLPDEEDIPPVPAVEIIQPPTPDAHSCWGDMEEPDVNQVDHAAKAEQEMLLAIKQRLQEDKYCDVYFVCQDGTRISANRAFLAARCDYFERMLFGVLDEAGSSEIKLPCVSSAAFLMVKDFLYLAMPRDLEPGPALVECYMLAQQYLLPTLQDIVVDVLDTCLKRSHLGSVLSEAIARSAEALVTIILRKIPAFMREKLSFEGFSVDAVVLCLRECYMPYSEADILDAVLAWAAAGINDETMYAPMTPPASPKLQPSGAPAGPAAALLEGAGGGDAASFADSGCSSSDDEGLSGGSATPCHPGAVRCTGGKPSLAGGTNARMARLLRPVWQHMKLHYVPPRMLEEKLEAQGLLPVPLLLQVFKLQALMMFDAAKYSRSVRTVFDPAHSGKHMIFEHERGEDVVVCSSQSHEVARTQVGYSAGVHEWSVTVAAKCEYIWLGVVDDSVDAARWGGRQEGGWFYGSNDALCHATRSNNGPYDVALGAEAEWAENGTSPVVRMRLDMDKRQLWVGVNGGALRLGFSNLPATVYPAVSIRTPAKLHFRMRKATGEPPRTARVSAPV